MERGCTLGRGPEKIGRDTDGAEGAGRESGQREGSESRVPEWGSVAGSPCRRAAEAAIHSPFQPEGEKLFGEGDGARRETSGGLSGGAKRLRRSRWERGTRERVARGGVRPGAGAGGYTTKIRLDASMECARLTRKGRLGL